ncbi:MAG: hypothetical protein JKY48_01370 [Flavobacteriales bacterium]|nr:hypothetical protein [Flavobacteriales bacterium]
MNKTKPNMVNLVALKETLESVINKEGSFNESSLSEEVKKIYDTDFAKGFGRGVETMSKLVLDVINKKAL